jgi:hypothetical protein
MHSILSSKTRGSECASTVCGALLLASFVACGSQAGMEASSGQAPAPAPTPTFGLTPKDDAGVLDASEMDGPMDATRLPRKEGSVSVELFDLTRPGVLPGDPGARVVAAFGDYAQRPVPFGGGVRCLSAPFGSCNVVTCQGPDFVGGPHAGTVTVASSSMNVAPVVMPPLERGGGNYIVPSVPPGVFALPGDTVTVSASGSNEIPAFRSEFRVDPPVAPRVTSLQLRPFGDYLIDKSKSVELAWEGEGRTGDVFLSVNQVRETGVAQYERHTIECSFPSALGKGAIPSAAFAQFFAGPATVLHATMQRKAMSVGGYAISTMVFMNTGGFSFAVP